MKRIISWSPFAFLGIGIIILLVQACNKNEDVVLNPESLTVTLPKLHLQNDLYYRIDNSERSVEMEFSDVLDTNMVTGNISLRDKTGPLDSYYNLVVRGKTVLLIFKSGFRLKEGWKYLITVKKGIQSVTGLKFLKDDEIELRTLANIALPGGMPGTDSTQRTAVAVISDIHMGDARATTGNYCWFGKNAQALSDFLDFVVQGQQVRQLVILGDLFDEWLIPYTLSPFDSSLNIQSSHDYCVAVAENPVNQPVFERLRAIALDSDIELIYVPGNHDMLVTQEIVEEIIPGVTWAGDVAGLGKYSPVDEMVLEHGHRFDFFNCPQPLVSPGHILPPGYFVSRLYAQGLMDAQGPLPKELWEYQGSFEFLAAWEVAFLYTLVHFDMPVPEMNEANIIMAGIDSYPDPFSFDGARDMYAANIEDRWDETQTRNEVPVHLNCCIQAIWNGHSDLFLPAMEEYIIPPAPKTYKIIAFGHTHEPMIAVYSTDGNYGAIYANSGSWINSEESSYAVRTFLMISPALWTGSDLDVVSLYQYNLDTESGDPIYKPALISEESIEAGN